MNPLPAHRSTSGKPDGEIMPSLPTALPQSSAAYSAANRRASAGCTAQRAYPWLLFASTAVAALFCLLYITKPVIVPAPAMIAPAPAGKPATAPAGVIEAEPATNTTASLLPSRSILPGEGQPQEPDPVTSDPRSALPGPPSVSAFEETNLRVQHVLTAQAPGGQLDRIVLDVPVLYQSRNLRWTTGEVAKARELLIRLMDYQEKSRNLRAEGVELLDAWNLLIEKSIPAADLRADSPSLPANQQDAADSARPAGLITTDSIQIRPAGK
ncbi:MAG: hypothetical protein EHM17_13200 [Verrucomicrobiaceae bacterium]|nr:MAG: hypothetical protein EHM17_13200 [Verrucomicrobiaceae bacterium]